MPAKIFCALEFVDVWTEGFFSFEVASVLKRSGLDKQNIMKLIESIEETFIVVDESVIYGKALETALSVVSPL